MDLVKKYPYKVEESLIKYSIDVSKIYYRMFSLIHVHWLMLTCSPNKTLAIKTFS
jgi:hypothetical protein